MPRFFVPASDIADGTASVRGSEFRHLQRVLRLREGDHVTLFDDAGTEHAGVVVSLSPRVALVRVTASTMPRRESPLALTLYQGIPKGRKMDLVVEKATELGVQTIVPFHSAFSLGAGAGAGAKRERWQRIAVAAAKQSGRTSVPAIAAPIAFTEVVDAAAAHDLRLLFFEGTGTVPFVALPEPATPPQSAAIAIGPEGGFSRDETAAARDAGFALVDMGPRILRTETAALVAATLVQARWGDLGAAHSHRDA
ncbi:MAG: 16S rRNA (uracil(1498)-N(3))-methyltransferase [Deltaproteobacteria bacterium]|nr:16S rRNA (uracil(1498)-N(3))-methyltransferase [Deltaproteobacteria bacterium]